MSSLLSRCFRLGLLPSLRSFSATPKCFYCAKETSPAKKGDAEYVISEKLKAEMKKTYRTDAIDRWILETFGTYKKGTCPEQVLETEIERAKSKFRIYASNVSIIVTLILCYISVQYGKGYKDRGDVTITDRSLGKHRIWRTEKLERSEEKEETKDNK